MRFRNTRTGRVVELGPDEARAAGLPSKHRPPKRGHRWEPVADDTPVDDGQGDDEPKPADVRAWAKAEGLDVPARGNLSAELVERYKAAHTGSDD